MSDKIQAAIPDSDLDLHVSGCYCVYEGVACQIERCSDVEKSVYLVNSAEGIAQWVPIDKVEFYWPDLGYVNTATGCVYCIRRAPDGRHYRRAFGDRSFATYDISWRGLLETQPRTNISHIVAQLYMPSYPTLAAGAALVRSGMRPSVAITKTIALAAAPKGIAVHIGGRVVGVLNQDNTLTTNDLGPFTEYITTQFQEASDEYNGGYTSSEQPAM